MKNLFRTDIARAGHVKVDRDKKVIHGFAVVTKGITHDERGEFDYDALNKIVELGNNVKMGIKSRFGHPNMSSTALGTFLGRVKKFRIDDDIVRADLHLDKSANHTPDGDLADYVMNLAESDPDAFGSSMVIHWDKEFRNETDDQEGVPPLIRVKKLLSVDIVDDPAANNGFFSETVKPSAEVTAFLDKLLSQPDVVEQVALFLDKYRINRQISIQHKENFAMYEDLTAEKLQKERPDIFESIEQKKFESGINEGITRERSRTCLILKKAASFHDMGDLAYDAVQNGLSIEQATIEFQEKQLENMQNSSNGNVGPDLDSGNYEKMSHLDRAKEFKAQYGGTMTEALKATAPSR